MSYGIKLYDPSGQTVVFSENIRTSNIQLSETFLLQGPYDSKDFTVQDAHDSTKMLFTFLESPTERDSYIRVSISTPGTNTVRVSLDDISINYGDPVPPQTSYTPVSVSLLGIRVG
jgi:hypothetical protein